MKRYKTPKPPSAAKLAVLRLIFWISTFFSVLSFAVFVFYLWQHYYNPDKLAFASYNESVIPQPEVSHLIITPSRITISRLNIDLPVFPIGLVNNRWVTPANGIAFLTNSPLPGSVGNSVFYGHNWPRLLGNLHKIELGDRITVSSRNGEALAFTVEDKKIVDPTDVSILSPSAKSQITLYTCTGILDSKRLVIHAKLD